MRTTIPVKNLSLDIVLIRASSSILNLFLIRELPELGRIHWDIDTLAYMISEVT